MTDLRLKGNGSFSLEAVGESHYQEALEHICGSRCEDGVDDEFEALVVFDDGNRFDSEAVRVQIAGRIVGYLSRPAARVLRAELPRLAPGARAAFCRARVRGGWDRGEGDRGDFGVRLDVM